MRSRVFLSFLDVLKICKLHFPPFLAIGLFTISLNYKIDQCSPIRAITSANKQIPPIVLGVGGCGGVLRMRMLLSWVPLKKAFTDENFRRFFSCDKY